MWGINGGPPIFWTSEDRGVRRGQIRQSPAPCSPVLPDSAENLPIGGPPDSLHCWVILILTPHCSLTTFDPDPTFPGDQQNTYTYTPMLAHIRVCIRPVLHQPGAPVSGPWGLGLGEEWLWDSAPNLSKDPKCGRCRGGRQPLDRAWTHLTSP